MVVKTVNGQTNPDTLQFITTRYSVWTKKDFMSKKIHNVNNIVRDGDLISNKLTRNILCSHKVTRVYLNILLDKLVDDR